MNSNQYSNNYGYNNQASGKHNLPPIAAISSAVNYRATAARSHRPSENTTATATGYTGQASYNQSSSYPAESSSSAYQYNNAGYTSNPATPYPEQQTSNYNTFNQRQIDPPSNSQPSYLVPQPIKANAATYSDSRFAMFPEPNSQKHLDNYIKPSSQNYNYTPLPNFKDLTSSYSQQQYTPSSQQSKQLHSMPKSHESAKTSGYSGANQIQVTDWLNKSDYQNQMNPGKSKTRNEQTDLYTKKLPSMSVPAASSFQPMEAKSSYQSSAGQNYAYAQGQGDPKALAAGYRTSSNNSNASPYQMYTSDNSLQRDHDGFKVPQQMQNLSEFTTKTGNTYQNSAQVNSLSSSGQYIPEGTKNTVKEPRKSFQHQSENYKGSKPPARYPYSEQKRTESLPDIAQYDYKINDRMQPSVNPTSNPSMKQSYSLNNLNTTSVLDNRYPRDQPSSNSPLDTRLSSYSSSESLHSSYMAKDLNIVDPRYSHPGATHQTASSNSIDNRNHQSFHNMEYKYQKPTNITNQVGKAVTSLDHRPPNISSNPNQEHQESAMYTSGYPSMDSKAGSSDIQMKNSYPLSSFISDKFKSMAANNNFQVHNDSKSSLQNSTLVQNSYNFHAQQYPRSQHETSASYYPQQETDRPPPISSSEIPHRTKMQSPQNVTSSYSKEMSNPSLKSSCDSSRSSVLNSPNNNLSNSSSQYKIPPSPKGSAVISPKGSIPNSPHSMVPLSPYSSVQGSQHYVAPPPQTLQQNVSMSPHTSIPHSPAHSAMPASAYHSLPSPSHQVPPSPSPYQSSRPPSAHQVPPPYQISVPPSLSPHQSSRPPSSHQVPPSPNQTFTPPSPHQNSRPPSAHQVPPSPSPHQNSRPPSVHHSPSPHQNSRPPSAHQVPPSPSPHQNSRPPSGHHSPSPHQNSRPPSAHQVPPSPSPHQGSRPSSAHQVPPSPSPHQNSRPPSAHHSPSPHQNSRPPSAHQVPPPLSPYQTSVPPSLSPHQSSRPPSSHQIPPSPNQTFTPPSPHQNSRPPSAHQVPPSPSTHQISTPATSSLSIPQSPTFHPSSIPISPLQTLPSSPKETCSIPSSALLQPLVTPSLPQTPDSSLSTEPQSSFTVAGSTTDSLMSSQSTKEVSLDDVEKSSTELKTETQQPSSIELCPVVQSSVSELCEKSSFSNSFPENTVYSMELEQRIKSPSVEFQTLFSLGQLDSVSTVNEISADKRNKDENVQNEPERLKTPELEKPESPESGLFVNSKIKENVNTTPVLCSSVNEDSKISSANHEGDISNNNDKKYKRQDPDDKLTLSREINQTHSGLNELTNSMPINDLRENFNSTMDKCAKEKTCDVENSKVESINCSLVPDVAEIEESVTRENLKIIGECRVKNDSLRENVDRKSSSESNQTFTTEPIIQSFLDKPTQDIPLKEEDNLMTDGEKNNFMPAVAEEPNITVQKNQCNKSVNDTLIQDKENLDENFRSVVDIDPSEHVEPPSKIHSVDIRANDMSQSGIEDPERTLVPENGQLVPKNNLEYEKHALLDKELTALSTEADDEIRTTPNGVSEISLRENQPIEENSKFYKANIIQSNINRMKDQRNKSVIENVVSNQLNLTVDESSLESTIEPIEGPFSETRLKKSTNVAVSGENEISSSKSKMNHYMNIHHSETTKILEHVAATLENHKRQLNYVSDSSDQSEVEIQKEIYVENSIPTDEPSDVIGKERNTEKVASYKIHENLSMSSRKEEPQNLCIERSITENTSVTEPLLKTNKDKVLNMDIVPATKNRSPHYFSPKDRILNYEHQMSIQAKINESKQTQPMAHENPHNLGLKIKASDMPKVESSKSFLAEHSRSKSDEHYPPRQIQKEKADQAKPLSTYEMYMKQLLSTSLECKSLKYSDNNDKKVKSTTVMPGIDNVPPPAHTVRDGIYNQGKHKSVSLPQASLNFQSKDLGLSQVQAAEKYKDIQFKQFYDHHQQQQKYSDYERFIMKQSAESSNHLAHKNKDLDLMNASNLAFKKESKPVKKQSRVSDKSFDSTSSRISLQDQQKEYMKLLHKQQNIQYNPKSTPESHKSEKQYHDKRQYVDQQKYQNYVQHLAQEEVIREKKRQQLSDQRATLQNYQDRQRYELEQLQLKKQSQLQNQHRSQQELQQYSPRQAALPSFQSKSLGMQGTPTNSTRNKELSQQNHPYMTSPNFNKQETKLDPLRQQPLQYDLTQQIKSQDYQYHQSLYNQRNSDQLNKPSRQSGDMNAQQYHQRQQQLAENMRRHQQSQQKNEQPLQRLAQEATRMTNEKQKSQPVKKRQYNPMPQVPLQNTQVASVSSTARSTIASPLDLSVKTVRQSADSTAKDEEAHRVVSSSVPKLDISPNFTNQQLMSSMFSAYKALPPQPHKKQKKAMAASPRAAQVAQTPFDPMRRDKLQQRYMGSASGSVEMPASSIHTTDSNVHSIPSNSNTHTMGTSNIHMTSPTTSNLHNMGAAHATSYNPFADYVHQLPPKPKVDQHSTKRPSTDINSISPVPSKFPKVDSWRQTIDFQIDQKLAKAQQQLQQNQASENQSPHAPPGHKVPQHPVHSLPSPSIPGHPMPHALLPTSNYPQQRATPLHPHDLQKSLHIVTSQPSALPPNHPSPSFHQNQHLLLQKQQVFNQHSMQQYREQQQQFIQYPCPAPAISQPTDKDQKTPVSREPSDPAYTNFPTQPSPGRQNLPPFNAISFDKSPFISRRNDQPEQNPMEPHPLGPKLTAYEHMFHGMPTVDNVKSAELDNVLAARIRTKAELKQNEPKTQLSGASPIDKVPTRVTSPIRADLPPKVAKENQQTIPLRKSRTEEEKRALARGMGVRSSSETSIFDFRDSDSEEEKVKPSGQQSLHEMRKDRRPPRTSNSSLSPRPSSPLPLPLHIVDHVNVYEDDAEPVEEAAWDNMFSDFVTYLEKKPKNLFKKKKQSPKQQKKREVGYAYVPVPNQEALAELQAKSRVVEINDAEVKRDDDPGGTSKVAVKTEASSDSEEEVKRVPKLSLKIQRPMIDGSSSDEDTAKQKPRPRAKVKKELPVAILPSSSSSSSSVSEVESSSESEEEDEDDEEEQEPIITKQLRSRCVGKESQKPEPKMSLRSRNPIVKLTRLEDVTKLSYAVKTCDEPPAVVKEEKKTKRHLVPVESTRSSKRRKQDEVKEEMTEEIELKAKKEERALRKNKSGEMKVKSEEKREKPKSKSATPDAKTVESEDTPSKRSARQSERTKKQKALETEKSDDKDKNSNDKDKKADDKDKTADEKVKEEKRPGWEEELYAFKRSLRMPASLIKITTPPGWPKARPSASLPDLDSRSASPLTCDSFDSEEKKLEEKDPSHKASFLNQLAQRYGATKKGKAKKKPEGSGSERKCKIIPQGSPVTRLLTPHVEDAQGSQSKRTRTEMKRDTIRRVFGDDRPASAPPATQGDTPPAETPVSPSQEHVKKKKKLEHGKMKKKVSPVSRTGLRSATKLRSNKVLLRQRIQKKRRSSQSNVNKALNLGQNCHQNKIDQGLVNILPRKHIKMKTMRRKFRSSGFDYIRKKTKKKHSKRHLLEEDLHKKIRMTMHSLGDTVEDVGSEIRSWVINKHHGETPLHRAARLGYIDAVAYCLEKLSYGAAPKDNAGYTPLHEAASHGWLDIARLLLMYGADPSDSAIGGIRPLHDAAEKGCVEMVRLLLSYGADPLLASYAGHTPLSITSDETTMKLLKYHLADVRGEQAPRWDFAGPACCFDKQIVGYEPLAKVNTKHLEPPADLSDVSIEAADYLMPHLYTIRSEPQTERWLLFSELQPLLKPPRTKDSLAKSLGQQPSVLYRDMKLAEFMEMVQCTSLGGQWQTRPGGKTQKITLVKYSEEMRHLLRIETVSIPSV